MPVITIVVTMLILYNTSVSCDLLLAGYCSGEHREESLVSRTERRAGTSIGMPGM